MTERKHVHLVRGLSDPGKNTIIVIVALVFDGPNTNHSDYFDVISGCILRDNDSKYRVYYRRPELANNSFRLIG